MDGAVDPAQDKTDEAASSSASVPSPAVVERWQKLLNIPKIVSTSTSSLSFGPKSKKPLQRWADLEKAPDFAAFRREDCLHASFEAMTKKHSDLWKLANHAANSSGAAAHALLTASTGVDLILECLRTTIGEDPDWKPWFTKLAEEAKKIITAPLNDAATCCASLYGLASTSVRQNVIKEADKSIQSVLKTKPPSDGYFFGNPADAIHAQMSYAYMSSAVKAKPSSSTRGKAPFASRPSAPPKRPPQSSSSTSKTSGNAGGRSSRGGKTGRKQ